MKAQDSRFPARSVAKLVACSLVALAASCVDSTPDDAAATDDVDPPVASEYVQTPNGLVHSSCITEIGEDDTIDDDGNVTRTDGTTYQIPACNYETMPNQATVQLERDARLALGDDDAGLSAREDKVVPGDDGWIEAAWWHSPHWMKKFHGRVRVPDAPASKGSQTIFLFPSFEPKAGNAIVQPVLQWGPSAAGGGKYWSIASWYVGPGRTVHGPLKKVTRDDFIYGSMTASACSSGGHCTWKVITHDRDNGATSTINVKTKVPYTEVQGGVLEAYGVTSCDQYPLGGTAAFSELTFSDHTHAVKPKFSKMYWKTSCKEKIVPSASLVFLNWN